MNEGQRFEQLSAECFPQPGSKNIVLWGDSGVAQYSEEMKSRFAKAGYFMAQFTLSACPPLVGLVLAIRPQCENFNEQTLATILKSKPDAVILGWAYWEDFEASTRLKDTLERLTGAGIFVVVLGAGPRFVDDVPKLLSRRAESGNADPLSLRHELQILLMQKIDVRLSDIISHYDGAIFLPIFATICPDERCPLLVDGVPVHFDIYHVTTAGLQLHLDRFFPDLLGRIEKRVNSQAAISKAAIPTARF